MEKVDSARRKDGGTWWNVAEEFSYSRWADTQVIGCV